MTTTADVLDFWFGAPGSAEHGAMRKVWFERNAAFDAEIAQRFGDLVEEAIAGELDEWEETPAGTLALLILLDQFPRNMFRGTARAFAGDARARAIARRAIVAGLDRDRPASERLFFYLPFEHSEDLGDQEWAVALFAPLGNAELDHFAVAHRDIIARFGRFPHRNAALGRETTPEEAAFLETPGSSF